jgi:hypothetical protein
MAKKTNPWMEHLSEVRKANKDKPQKEIFKIAKGSYKK